VRGLGFFRSRREREVALQDRVTAAEQRAFALTDMLRWQPGGAGVIATESEVHGIPALHRAVRLRSEAVASLHLCCWSGYGPERVRRESVWQSRLFGRTPNEYQSVFGFWETVGESLGWRNNAFIWKNVDPLTELVTDWWALHPDQVQPEGSSRWKVTVSGGYLDPVGRGKGDYVVGPETILHIRGHGAGGTRLAPSPIQVFRLSLAGPVSRQRHENRMWRRGSSLQLALEFPVGVSKEAAEEFREIWRSSYEGQDGESTAIIGGGAEIKPIGMTQVDAQFVEMADLTVRDASLIMAVPENLLRQVADSTPNLEQDVAAWLKFGLGPELGRIEKALEADLTLFGNAQTYPGFDTDMFVRGDLKTEAQVLVSLVQAGILTPNEARALRGMDSLGAAGDIPQITPVGGAPNAPPLTVDTGGGNEA
jgi:HK97 family phage portal protein